MTLSIGELVAYVNIEDKGFNKTLGDTGKDLAKLASKATDLTRNLESTMDRAFAQISRSIDDGLDPNAALVDLDRLVSSFDSAMDDMVSDARTGGQEAGQGTTDGLRSGMSSMESVAHSAAERAVQAVDRAFGSLDEDLREDGRKAGGALTDGLDQGLGDVRGIGRRAGEDVADGFDDGGTPKLKEAGGGWLSVIKGFGWLEAGSKVGELLMGGIETAMDRETITATLAAKVGAFGPESERLGRIAGELYANAYGESREDVADALASVIQNFDDAGKAGDDTLKSWTSHAMDVSKVMGEDVGRVTAAVAAMLRTGLAPNAEAAFDILTRGAQSGVNKSEDLIDSFEEYSTIFRSFGINAQEALGLMSQGLKGGARDSDVVADALLELQAKIKDLSPTGAGAALKALGINGKDALRAITKGGKPAHEMLDKILTRFKGVQGTSKEAGIAAGLFGTKAEDMGKAINGLNLDKAKTAVGGFKDAIKTVDKEFGSTAAASAESWSRSWENKLGDIGGVAMKSIQQLLPSPADWDKQWADVTGWFSDTVGPFFSDTWNSVKNKTVEIWNGIGDWLGDKASSIADAVGELPGKVGNFFSSGWESVKTTTSEKWESIKSAVVSKATAALDWLKAVPGKVGGFFSSGWDTVKSITSEKWESIKNAVVEKGTAALDWVKALPGKIKDVFASAGTWLLQAGKDLIAGLINGIKAEAGRAVEAAKGVVSGAVDAAKHLLGIASPSKVFHEIGRNVALGLAKGIEVNEGTAIGTAVSVVKKAMAAANAELQRSMVALNASINASITKKMEPKVNASITKTMVSKPGFVEPSQPSKGPQSIGGTPSGVYINMPNAVIREHADIDRIGSKVAFDVVKRG